MSPLRHHATAFGLHWQSDLALDGFAATGDGGDGGIDAATIRVHRVDRLAERPDGQPVHAGFLYPDGIRFAWEDEVVFDMTDGTDIAYRPGRDWTGTMPVGFYSTLAALTLAWRGLVPLHACAVEVDGKALLIAGMAGAGKSTLTAELLGLGARFIADDLIALDVGTDGIIAVPRGRPTIRLHPDTAARLDMIRAEPVIGDARGKWIAWPRRQAAGEAVPLGLVLLLEGRMADDHPPGRRADFASAARLLTHLFRPQRLTRLPTYPQLVADTLAIATRVPVLYYPVQDDCSEAALRMRAEAAMAHVRAAL